MTQSRDAVSRRDRPLQWLWLNWAIACTIAGAIVGALEDAGFQFMATLVFTGILVGTAQWIVLRRYIPMPVWWILASALGWFIGIQLTISLSSPLDSLFGWSLASANAARDAVTVAMMGIAQWLLLNSYSPRLDGWVLVSALGGIVKGALGTVLCAVACEAIAQSSGATAATATVYAAGWAGYGILTGLFLTRFFQSR